MWFVVISISDLETSEIMNVSVFKSPPREGMDSINVLNWKLITSHWSGTRLHIVSSYAPWKEIKLVAEQQEFSHVPSIVMTEFIKALSRVCVSVCECILSSIQCHLLLPLLNSSEYRRLQSQSLLSMGCFRKGCWSIDYLMNDRLIARFGNIFWWF